MDSSDDSDSDMERGSSRSRDRKSEHKMPRWDGAKESFDDCWFRASAYLDAENLLQTAMGKDTGNATDPNKKVREAYEKKNKRVFSLWIGAINDKKKTGKALMLLIKDDFKLERDGRALTEYLQRYAEKLTFEDVKRMKSKLRSTKLSRGDSYDTISLKM